MRSFTGGWCGLLAILAIASPVFADNETEQVESGSLESRITDSEDEESGFEVSFELRPTWTPAGERFHSDNDIEVEYRFSPGFALGYTQGFEVKIHDPSVSGRGLEAEPCLGFLGAEFGPVWKSRDSRTTLNFTARVSAPTEKEDREAGMLTGLGTFLKFRHEVTPVLSLNVLEAPILHVYDRAGAERGEDETANPRFENRLGIAAELSFFKKALKVRLPAVAQTVRFAEFDGDARHNDSWALALWVMPEVTYALSKTTTIGVAYAENLVKDESRTVEKLDFVHSGTAQLIFQQSL